MLAIEHRACLTCRLREVFFRTNRLGGGVDAFPHLQTMDGDILIDLETQSHRTGVNLEHGDFEQALETAGASNDHGFLFFPRQNQHVTTSVFMQTNGQLTWPVPKTIPRV